MDTHTRLFATEDELIKLTGYLRKSKQAAWLRQNAIPFRVNARQEPVVNVSDIITPPAQLKKSTTWEPNLNSTIWEPNLKPTAKAKRTA